ncbi:MAG TPA: FAD/NAD(P)-binding oxidoreductase [Terriglobales bacterium]|nr:FAD/NAD(P)-binding oxidoreductase [Terriglobales bacterium]
MDKISSQRFEILIVGAGPAGISAAIRAAEGGARVGTVDDNRAPGGQIWRADYGGTRAPDAARWTNLLETAPITKLCGTRVFHQPEPGVLLAEGSDILYELHYRALVIATGARERFHPFPGWTLPNVMGAGGLQAMVKSGLPVRGKRVVVAGSGPLLLAVAAYLRQHGAEIPIICEQASWRSMAKFGVALLSDPGKIAQGLKLKRELIGIPFAANSWPVAAHGRQALESVTISRAGKSTTIPCDYLACGFHLVPNAELAMLLGCEVNGGYVKVDEFQRTSAESIFCAGEPTGIGGVELSLIEGQIAGLAATGRIAEAKALFGKRRRARRFAEILDRTFRLRPQLARLPSAETVVCRCEDVTYSRLQAHASWRGAKLHTRCGMGPCQGRVCGPAAEFLFNWKPDSVRPPVFPARVENLAALYTHQETERNAVSRGKQ